jgi:polyhydroxyalkanoate synthase subunit PhaC
MSKNSTKLPQAEHVAAFGHAVGEIWKSMQGLSMPMPALSGLQAEYLKDATALWNGAMARAQAKGELADKGSALGDRRFAANDWASNPAAAMAAQTYLLNARTLMKMADAVEGDAKTKCSNGSMPRARATTWR